VIGRPRRVRAASLAALAALLATASAAVGAAPPIRAAAPGVSPVSGIQDAFLGTAPNPAPRIRTLAQAGAAVIRVDLRWDEVAPTRPGVATDPADPAYRWQRYDQIVAAARANGVKVLFSVYGTPPWARDPSIAPDVRWPAASIRPADPADFGRFGEAAARRYGPLGVKWWEAWNEPQISTFLRPQYTFAAGRWQPVSPATYSALLSAFYTRVKAVDPAAVIAGAVASPAGEKCPCTDPAKMPERIPPDVFVTALGAAGLRPPMDVVSHHPYPVRKPSDTTPPGRSFVDLYNLTTLIRAIDATYLRGKRLWLTEYGFSTRAVPQYRLVFSPAAQASAISDAYRRVRATPRVGLMVYYLFQDHPGWFSGVLDLAGRRKPGYSALALPLAATPATPVRRGRLVTLVGQVRGATRAVPVLIQYRSGSRWLLARRVTTGRDGSFRITLRPAATTALRATWTGRTRGGTVVSHTSLPVTVRVR
jgi:hypothetical protein